MELICPVCHAPLFMSGKSFYCEKKHCFDRAKSGYVNLLLSNAKHSKIPGDNKLMVNARTQFLDKGYYQPLADELCHTVLSLSKDLDCLDILDAGCGEGYYTNQIYHALANQKMPFNMVGVDISKFALDRAAKRNPEILYAVASIFHLPVENESCSMLFNLFAPFCQEEFVRVLKPSGYFVMVIPGKYHLWELKQAIYERPYPNEVQDYEINGFRMCKVKNIDIEIELKSQEDIEHLIMMTPYFYKTSKEDYRKVKNFTTIRTRIQFEILIYQKENHHD
jgi:23S rRNA (guanine745-N1)-methyltransferase